MWRSIAVQLILLVLSLSTNNNTAEGLVQFMQHRLSNPVRKSSPLQLQSRYECNQILPATSLYAESKDMDEDRRDFTSIDGWNETEEDGWTSREDVDKANKKELESLQEEIQQRRWSTMTTVTSSKGVIGEDRDMFIPIFALVSLSGLFGAYGYEMLRLASRGELYLPWQN